jgi:predicted nucleic acid-binding Zn ribbon protein
MLYGGENISYPSLRNTQPERRNAMPLIQLVIILVVVGVVLWVINSYIPMQSTIKKILNLVVIIVVIVWLLSVFGFIDKLSTIRIGK